MTQLKFFIHAASVHSAFVFSEQHKWFWVVCVSWLHQNFKLKGAYSMCVLLQMKDGRPVYITLAGAEAHWVNRTARTREVINWQWEVWHSFKSSIVFTVALHRDFDAYAKVIIITLLRSIYYKAEQSQLLLPQTQFFYQQWGYWCCWHYEYRVLLIGPGVFISLLLKQRGCSKTGGLRMWIHRYETWYTQQVL